MVDGAPNFYIYCCIPDIISVISVTSMLAITDTIIGTNIDLNKNSFSCVLVYSL